MLKPLKISVPAMILLSFSSVNMANANAQNLDYDGNLTAIYQQANTALLKTETTFSADLNLQYQINSARFFMHLEAASSPQKGGVAQVLAQSNADSGSALNAHNEGRAQLSEIYVDFQATPKTKITAGLIDATAFLDSGLISNDENTQFIATTLVNNPIIDFPDYALGVVLEHTLSSHLFGRLLVSSSHGLADNPARDYSQAFEIGSDQKGLFLDTEVSYQAQALQLSSGIWMHTAPHEALNNPQNNDLKNYGAYLNAYHAFGKHALETRLSYANPEVSSGEAFWSLAYKYQNPKWIFGAGYSLIKTSNKVVDQRYQSNPQLVELYVSYPMFKYWNLTPSVQYFENAVYNQDNWQLPNAIWTTNLRLSYLF